MRFASTPTFPLPSLDFERIRTALCLSTSVL
jgi:hypothetical protein